MANANISAEKATIKVCFIKPGTPYGYGYAAGEFGLVHKSKYEDEKFKDKQGNDQVKKGLLALGVVRAATDAEYSAYISEQESALSARKPSPSSSSRSVAAPPISPEIIGFLESVQSALLEQKAENEELKKRIAELEKTAAELTKVPASPDVLKK